MDASGDDSGEKRFNVELYKIRGGAKSGLRLATIYILADEGLINFIYKST